MSDLQVVGATLVPLKGWTVGLAGSATESTERSDAATTCLARSQLQTANQEDIAMPVEIDESTRRCTLIGEDLRLEAEGPDIEIVTDEQLRMSVALLANQRVPITEAEADALTVAGAVDSRRHLKASTPGSVI
jgi:hypothetical protein